MSCPAGTIQACDFGQFLVQQTPKFDQIIMEDIRPIDSWIGNVSIGSMPMGTPAEVTQDRFRSVFPNTTKTWTKVNPAGVGCAGNPCDPTEHEIGIGSDRLTFYPEQQTWRSPLWCFDQLIHITHAKDQLTQYINKVLRPATSAIGSTFLRKRTLFWSKTKWVANANAAQAGTDGVFTYTWTLGGINGDDELYFDCSAAPARVFLLTPQMLQSRFTPLMMIGYGGQNPFKETAPYIELVTDIDTCWLLDKLGGQQGVGGTPSIAGNWRFMEWSAANEYWRYGFSGQIGNFMVRVDNMGLRFNYVGDLGAGAAPNRYRYQVILPYVNGVTTGAGGAAGLGSDFNPDFQKAHFRLSFIHHKKGLELLVQDATPINSDMPFGHRDFGGRWRFAMHDLGADVNGVAISNKWENKGQFLAWFQYWIRPLNYEFLEAIFHKSEIQCIPEISTCSADPGYPDQSYNSSLPECDDGDLPTSWPDPLYGSGVCAVPTGDEDGPILADRSQPAGGPDY